MSLFSYNSTSKTTSTGMKYSFGTGQSSSNPSNQLNSASTTSTTSTAKLNQFDYAPKRFGVRYDPPTIILEYLIPSSGKLYHHKMKILNLRATSSSEDVLVSLQKKHPTYFSSNKILDEQIISLIDKLKKNLPKQDTDGITKIETKITQPAKVGTLFNTKPSYTPSDQEKINTGDGNKPFTFNLGGNGTFGKIAPIATNKKAASPSEQSAKKFWDEDSQDEYEQEHEEEEEEEEQEQEQEQEEEDEDDLDAKLKSNQLNKNQLSPQKAKANSFWDIEDEDEDGKELDYNTVSLNKLSTEELSKHKKKMDVLFSKNQKKPGDLGFVYDLQEEFKPHQENEWDEEIEEL